MKQKKAPSYWKKTAVILGLVLFVAAGALISGYWSTSSLPGNDQTSAADKPENAALSAVPATHKTPANPASQQPVAAVPAAGSTTQPAPATSPVFTAVTPSDDSLDIIRSFDPQLSDWQGQFQAGVQSRKVELNQTLFNNHPLQKGTRLTLQLFDDVRVEAVVSDSFKNVNGTISTTANLDESRWGRVFIASTDEQVHARIRIPEKDKIYAIQYNPETGQHYTLELDPVQAEPPEGDDQLFPLQVQADEADIPIASFNGAVMEGDEGTDSSTVVDIMVVYTDDALANAGSLAAMNNNIALGISMANDAHNNTDSSIVWYLVYSYEVAYAETGNNSSDLNCITNTDGCLDAILTQRNTQGADFVMMMNGTGSGGIAWVLQSSSGNAGTAFSVVDDNSFLSYTPAHEVGHNMGLSHARDQNFQAGPTSWSVDAYGFGTTTAGWHWHPTAGADGYCSVMTYTSGSYFADGLSHVRVGVFSDPNILDHGMATGHATLGYSARVLRQLRQTYAGYRSRFSTATIQVDSPNGGEMLIAGNTYTLLWDSYGVSGNVKIELLRNGSLNQVIDADTLNDRVYAWTIPTGLSGTDFTIRVSNLAGTLTDTSDAAFKISTMIYDEPLDSNPGYTISGTGWEFGQPVAVNNATYGGPGEAYTGTNIYDTNLDGASFSDSTLTSTAIDCSDYQDVHLKFMGQFSVYENDSATVQVSNNGTTWAELYTVNNQWTTGWTKYEYDISSVADGQNTVYIRWFYDDGSASSYSGMSVDDIQLFGISTKPYVSLSISPASISENSGSATVTATLSRVHTEIVTTTLDFSGTATYGVDYIPSASTITIHPGFTTGTAIINSIDDSADEADETVVVNIDSVTNGTENGFQQVTTTLVDDDHTVTFQTDGTPGATLTGNTIQTVSQGGSCSPVTANEPAGYVFTGWSGGASGTANPLTVTNVSSSLLITANYGQTYTVSYDGNGNTAGSAPSSQIKIQDVDLTLASNSGSLSKTGYTFSGWNTAANGTGTDYAEGAIYSSNAPVILYAKWTTLPSYTVTYNANNATSGTVPPDQTKTQGTDLTLDANSGNLEKTGYTCTGWNTEADGTGTDYDLGELYTVDAAITLYAKWTALSIYSVSYNANNATSGTVPPNQTKTEGIDLILATNSGNLARTGYTFTGWNTAADGTGTNYPEGGTYSIDAPVILFAKWKAAPNGFSPAIFLLLQD